MILGLDLETTGLNVLEDRIVELCAGLYADDGRLMKNVTMRFNPCKAIDPKAQAVHHISNAELMTCPKFKDRAEIIGRLLGKAKLIVIHNAGFDAPFLKNELERCGVKAPHIPVYDTMLESRWATPDGKIPRLGELCWALDIDYDTKQAHGAEYDVTVMMNCLFKLEKLNFFTNNVIAFDEIKPEK